VRPDLREFGLLGHEGLAGPFILGKDLPEGFPALNKLRHGVGRGQQLRGPERADLVQGDQPPGHGCLPGPNAAGKIRDRRRRAGDVLLEFVQFGLERRRAPAMALQGARGGLQRAGDIALIARDPVELGFLLLDVLPQRVGLFAQGFDGAALPGAALRSLGVGVPPQARQAQDQERAHAPGDRWRCGC